MLSLVLLALTGQVAHVDESFVPKPGEKAVIGFLVHGPGEERDRLVRAECFATLDQVRASILSAGDDLDGRLVSSGPDAYFPRAGTPVQIVDVRSFRVEAGESKIEGAAYRVRVLEGEFRGKLLFTRKVCLVRLVGEGEAVAKAPARKKRPAPRPAPVGDLVLTDLAVEPNPVTKFASISGRIRNTSDRELEAITVSIAVEDRAGKMIHSTQAFATPTTIEPGGLGTFQAIVEDDPRAAGVKLDFKDLRRAIPWVDRSGKDVHE